MINMKNNKVDNLYISNRIDDYLKYRYKLKRKSKLIKAMPKATALALSIILFGRGFTNKYSLLKSNSEQFESPNEIYNVIEQNEHLDENEKEMIYYISDFIEDYYQYFDKELVSKRLEDFEVKYKKTNDRSVVGSWSPFSQKMCFYNINNSTQIKNDQDVASHEMMHLVCRQQFLNYSTTLGEAIDSLICYEYSDYEDINLYYKHILIAQCLCELTTSDTVVESYLQADLKLLKKEIKKIDASNTRVNRLIMNIESFHNAFCDYAYYLGQNLNEIEYRDYLNAVTKKDNILTDIEKDLKYYYEKKEGRSITEDDVMYQYLSALVHNDDIVVKQDDNYKIYLDENSHPPKSKYFVKQ